MSGSWESLVENLVKGGILRSPRIIRAMRLVPRNLFVPDDKRHYSTIDSPLPIGEGQTVSAPLG